MADDQISVAKPVEIDGEPSVKMGGPTAQEARKMRLMKLRAFCSEVSIVGLRYVANPSASVCRRSIWLLLLLAGAAFTTYQIVDRTAYYFSYPTNVDIYVQHVPEMRFPTVTICNENLISLSGATKLRKL